MYIFDIFECISILVKIKFSHVHILDAIQNLQVKKESYMYIYIIVLENCQWILLNIVVVKS